MSRNIEMNYFNGNKYEILYPTISLTNTVNSLSATKVSYSNSSTSSIITSNQVQGAIDDLFTSVSDGKSLIAEAITDKGVSTSSSANFATMASNIGKIETAEKFKHGVINSTKVNYQQQSGSGLTTKSNYLSINISTDFTPNYWLLVGQSDLEWEGVYDDTSPYALIIDRTIYYYSSGAWNRYSSSSRDHQELSFTVNSNGLKIDFKVKSYMPSNANLNHFCSSYWFYISG